MDNYSEKIKDDNDNIFYYNGNGKAHRLDGPAFINDNYKYKRWWVNGKLHRVDGPASEWNDEDKYYWLYDIKIDEEKHKIHSDSIFGVMYGY